MIEILAANSAFTADELSSMNVSTIYQAYNLIIRNNKKGIEDEIRIKLRSADVKNKYSAKTEAPEKKAGDEEKAKKKAERRQVKDQKKAEKEQKKNEKRKLKEDKRK